MIETFDDLLAQSVIDGACIRWTGTHNQAGYGRVRIAAGELLKSVHRVAYEMANGPIPSGLHIDHLCRVRDCFNPHHLEAVTPAENTRRASPAQRTHCPRGHEYTAKNTTVSNGCRTCLTCKTRKLECHVCGSWVSLRNMARHRRDTHSNPDGAL